MRFHSRGALLKSGVRFGRIKIELFLSPLCSPFGEIRSGRVTGTKTLIVLGVTPGAPS